MRDDRHRAVRIDRDEHQRIADDAMRHVEAAGRIGLERVGTAERQDLHGKHQTGAGNGALEEAATADVLNEDAPGQSRGRVLSGQLIAPAPADIAGHALDDLLIGQARISGDHGRRLHDLAALAEAALRHIQLAPRDLHGMVAIRAQAFDGRDLDALGIGHRDDARPCRLAIEVHGAGAAKTGPAAVFAPGQPEYVSQGYQSKGILGSPSN
jgi:hypothetical protein